MRWGELTKGKRAAPEPLEGNVVAVVVTGTLVFALLFLAQLPFYGWYADHGHTQWIWTALAGAGLGLIGLWYVKRREAAIRAADRAARTEEEPGGAR